MRKATKKIACAALAAVMAVSFAACSGKEKEESTQPAGNSESQQVENVVRNPITNEEGYSEAAVGKRPISFAINNAPKARPQWGLNSADAVFELPVEGFITRMLWVFADYNNLPEKIGPIRSARHHFVYTAASIDSIYTHWGGSTMGKEALKENNIDDIDQMRNAAEYFYRDQTRTTAIEHRGVTSGDLMKKAVEKLIDRKEINGGEAGAPFIFSKNEVKLDQPCNEFMVYFSGDGKRSFKYNGEDGLYYNSLNGKPFTDGNTGKQNAVKNVIVLYAPAKTLPNELMDVDLTGGEGFYATNGTYKKITWKKGNDVKSKFVLTYEDGSTVELNTGKTWINIVPKQYSGKTTMA